MLFILLGLSLFEIIASVTLQNGVPYSTRSYKTYFYYDIQENNTLKIINGSVQIYYKEYIKNTFNYLYITENSNNEKQEIYINFYETERVEFVSFNFTFIPTNPKSTEVCLNFDIQMFMVFNVTITVNEIGRILILENGISQNFTDLLMGQFYYVLIYCEDKKNANISLSLDYNTKQPFNYMTIYEHSSPNSKWESTLESDNQI